MADRQRAGYPERLELSASRTLWTYHHSFTVIPVGVNAEEQEKSIYEETLDQEDLAPEEKEDVDQFDDTEIALDITDDNNVQQLVETNATEDTDETKCGDNLTWSLSTEGTLYIGGTGDMYDFATSADNGQVPPWHDDANEVKKLIIDNEVTSIGACAFYGCYSLVEAYIGSGVSKFRPMLKTGDI